MARTSTLHGVPPDVAEATDERRCANCDCYSAKLMYGSETPAEPFGDHSAGKCFRDIAHERGNLLWWVEAWMVCEAFRPDLPMRERIEREER